MISKEDLKDLLSFTKGERNAIVFLFILISSWGTYAFISKKYFNESKELHPEFRDEVKEYLNAQCDDTNLAKGEKSKVLTNKEIELFSFDPNTISLEEWQKLGLSEKQAEVILKYKNKGGVFRIKKDVKKMYSVSDEMYEQWEPYIQLPIQYTQSKKEFIPKEKDDFETKEYQEKNIQKNFYTHENISVELNSADTSGLKKLYGIGSYYAYKIIEYREQLGGYIHFDQLREIWKMREETLEKIRPYIEIDSADIRKLTINTIEWEQLKKHPYLSYKEANAIINYRKQHGRFDSEADLKKIILLSEETINKIGPYLSYD